MLTFTFRFQLEKSTFVAPATIINDMIATLNKVNILLRDEDSLTPIIIRHMMTQVNANAKKSGYMPMPLMCMGNCASRKLLSLLPNR